VTASSPTGRLLIANLDCEASWQGGRPPSPRALATASAFGTLLRVLAEPGDRLWTPLPVDPARLPEVAGVVAGLARPQLVSGPLTKLAPSPLICAWGETAEVAALRDRVAAEASEAPACEARRRGPLAERLWRLPASSPAVAARANHRRYGFELAAEFGCALPGTRWLASPADLERWLAGAAGEWVLKSPLSTAGRGRLLLRAGAVEPDLLRRAASLVEQGGGALAEPWLERTLDLGSVGLVGEQRVRWLGSHRQLIAGAGRFEGVVLEADGPSLAPAMAERLEEIAREVGERLRRDGYRGPYGVDAFVYRQLAGGLALQPLCEINARLSFGHVARLLAERIGGPAPGEVGELRLRATDDPVDGSTGEVTLDLLAPETGRGCGASAGASATWTRSPAC
jgi:hypothetical protein